LAFWQINLIDLQINLPPDLDLDLAFWQLDFANQFDRFAEPRYVKEI
jgi:hypothetical protein